MRVVECRVILVTMTLAVGLLSGACAKRPVATAAAAPAPTAAAPTPAPAPVAPPAPAAPAPPLSAPIPRASEPKEFRPTDALKTIYFDFDKATIGPADARVLEASAAWLKANSNRLLLIEGHCDERGTPDYNVALGDRRAKAAQSYLTAQGVRADRITIISYGEQRPACADHGERCWAQNRRAQFLVKEQ
jgi:peptidoglycan-associated lipoprotein